MTIPPLDDLLDAADPTVSAAAEEQARALARASFTARPRLRWTRTRTAVVAGAATLAVAAAGTTAAYQLSIPPFMTLEEGSWRTSQGVPVNGVTDAGLAFECLAFVEARHATRAQQAAIEEMVRTTDWGRYGQRQYDALSATDRAAMTTAPGPLAAPVSDDLQSRAADVSGLPLIADRAPAYDEPAIAGAAITCADPNGST